MGQPETVLNKNIDTAHDDLQALDMAGLNWISNKNTALFFLINSAQNEWLRRVPADQV